LRLSENGALIGDQRPRICTIPPAATSTGEEAIHLCKIAGLHLDPWEQFLLDAALGETEDGLWAASEVGICVARQNGKGVLLEARELTGLFLLEEEYIVHTAHLYTTAMDGFRRLEELIAGTPEFSRKVKRFSRTNGKEGVELKTGQQVAFRTRTAGGGRGLGGSPVLLDEAMSIPEAAHRALYPLLTAQSNPQIWYTGSAVDEEEEDNGVVFAKVRERGMAGDDPRLMYAEFSPDCDSPEKAGELLDNPEAWAQANPGLGIRIGREYIEGERRAMSSRGFAVERLSIGAWPSTEEIEESVIDRIVWKRREDPLSEIVGPVALAIDVSPSRATASISAAGFREDGKAHVEYIKPDRDEEDLRVGEGTGWVVDRLVQLIEDGDVQAIGLDKASPAASLLKELEDRLSIELTVFGASEYAQACGVFYDAVVEDGLRHIGQAPLTTAVEGAKKRPLRDAFAWSRKESSVDITPLVSSTLALAIARSSAFGGSVYEDRGLVVL
jgi:hypothetical protein